MSNIPTGNATDALSPIHHDDEKCESGLGFIPSVFIMIISAIIASAGMVVEKRAHIRLVEEGGKSYNYCCDKLWVSREVICVQNLTLSFFAPHPCFLCFLSLR